jgi:hypothetical protein
MNKKPIQTPEKAVLGDAVRDGLMLWLSCTDCRHRKHIGPAVLARDLGYDFPLPDLKRRMKCSRCGGRDIEVRLDKSTDGPVARHTPVSNI